MSKPTTAVRSTRRRRLSRPHCPRKAVARIESWIDHTRLASGEDNIAAPRRTVATKRCHKSSFSRVPRRQRKVSTHQLQPQDKMVLEAHFAQKPLAVEEQPLAAPLRAEGPPHPALVLLISGFAIGTLLPLILLLLVFTTLLHLAPSASEDGLEDDQVRSNVETRACAFSDSNLRNYLPIPQRILKHRNTEAHSPKFRHSVILVYDGAPHYMI
jgi:hypothetical protein